MIYHFTLNFSDAFENCSFKTKQKSEGLPLSLSNQHQGFSNTKGELESGDTSPNLFGRSVTLSIPTRGRGDRLCPLLGVSPHIFLGCCYSLEIWQINITLLSLRLMFKHFKYHYSNKYVIYWLFLSLMRTYIYWNILINALFFYSRMLWSQPTLEISARYQTVIYDLTNPAPFSLLWVSATVVMPSLVPWVPN